MITALVGVIAVCYLVETILDRPDWGQIGCDHAVVPQFAGTESVLLATGILGATVMPHVIFLHSALTQGRIVVRDAGADAPAVPLRGRRRADRHGRRRLVNAAMLIMAASTFHSAGHDHVGTIEEAYQTLEPLLGRPPASVFAISLLASGLSSSAVGTMAGQVIMQGFLHRTHPALAAPAGDHGARR